MNKEHEQDRVCSLRMFETPCTGKCARFHGGNCVHCCLRGNGLPNTADGKGEEPNYSGWGRIYVQAGKVIPQRFTKAFIKECNSENILYREALLNDIEYFGVTLSR